METQEMPQVETSTDPTVAELTTPYPCPSQAYYLLRGKVQALELHQGGKIIQVGHAADFHLERDEATEKAPDGADMIPTETRWRLLCTVNIDSQAWQDAKVDLESGNLLVGGYKVARLI